MNQAKSTSMSNKNGMSAQHRKNKCLVDVELAEQVGLRNTHQKLLIRTDAFFFSLYLSLSHCEYLAL